MRIGKLRNCLAAGLLAAAGCSEISEKFRPDSVTTGVVYRQISGRHRGYKVDTGMPMGRIQVDKIVKKRLRNGKKEKELEINAGVDYIRGELGASHSWMDGGRVNGHAEVFNLGATYFPLDDNFGLKAGVGFGNADFDMRGGIRPIRMKTPDSVQWFEFNLGAVYEFKLDERTSLFFEGGYSFAEEFGSRASVNLDGWRGFFGLRFNLTGK